jgi:hypothetical protein
MPLLHRCHTLVIFALATAAAVIAAPASAQQSTPADTRTVAITGALDVRNAYMFRGIRQDDTGVITWPAAEVALRLHSADNGLTSVRVHVGTFNSLHSGWAGSDGLSGKRWYESNVYTTLALGFGNGLTVGTTYTAYRSPNKMFTTVKEISVKASVDRAALGGTSFKPYGLAAFELDTKPGIGQLDGGFKAGTFLELGAAPGYSVRRIGVAVPVKVGLSLGNYYELAGRDRKFGYASVSGVVTVPLGGIASSSGWNLHGGVEYQMLGDMPKAINDGDGSKVIGSVGIGFAY